MHPLESAYRKLSWGIHHRAEANRLVKAFMKTKPYSFHSEFESETGDKVWLVDGTPRQPPIGISIAVGDAIYDLRSALDHLAYQLVVINPPNSPSTNTAFPISDTTGYWDRWWESKTKGMSDKAIALIKTYQPCFQTHHYQGLWASWLEGLCNIDKHRHLHLTLPDSSGGLWSHPLPFDARSSIHQGPIEPHTELARVEQAYSDVEYGFFGDVAFAKTGPASDETVIPALRGMEVLVKTILDDFGRRFFSPPLPSIGSRRSSFI